MKEELIDFIEEHGLEINLFFDAKGKPVSHIKEEMKSKNKIFAYNSTPCQSNDHTTRSIAGHCIECDTSRIEFTKRHYNLAYVYIAGSVKGQIIKIGCTTSISKREKSLIASNIGGVDDWKMIFHIHILNAGMVENKTQSELEPYLSSQQYYHNSHIQVSKELFKCSFIKAKQTIFEVVENLEMEIIQMKEEAKLVDNYNFRNLRRMP